MFGYHGRSVSGRLARAIEDAILFGQVREIDAILERIDGDDAFPEDLRYGLEALRHFREHYARDPVVTQTGSQTTNRASDGHAMDMVARQIRLIESAWGSELLDMLDRGDKAAKAL